MRQTSVLHHRMLDAMYCKMADADHNVDGSDYILTSESLRLVQISHVHLHFRAVYYSPWSLMALDLNYVLNNGLFI